MSLMSLLFCVLLILFLRPKTAFAAAAVKILSTPSCPACARMARVLDNLTDKYPGKVTVEKVNLHEHLDIAKQYNVRYVPHLLFLDADGNVFSEKTGAIPLDEVLKIFSEAGVSLE